MKFATDEPSKLAKCKYSKLITYKHMNIESYEFMKL